MHLVPRDWWPWLMVAAGVIALAGMVALIRVVVRQRNALSEAGARVTLSQQCALERDVSALLRDLSDMARQVGSQLDARGAAGRVDPRCRRADGAVAGRDASGRAAHADDARFIAGAIAADDASGVVAGGQCAGRRPTGAGSGSVMARATGRMRGIWRSTCWPIRGWRCRTSRSGCAGRTGKLS